jgi:hypothetical protein
MFFYFFDVHFTDSPEGEARPGTLGKGLVTARIHSQLVVAWHTLVSLVPAWHTLCVYGGGFTYPMSVSGLPATP